MTFIRVSVSTIEDFFKKSRTITLPWFQRAYAWREENVMRLVSDVMAAMRDPKQRYSLGHVHIAGEPDAETIALVDGHQRAITFMMMFAVLRDLTAMDQDLSQDDRTATTDRLQTLIGKAGRSSGEPPAWRLLTQRQMADFFERYIQQPGGALLDPVEDLADLTPAERNLIDNRDRLREAFGDERMQSKARIQLIDFLLTRCPIMIVEVDDEDEAWAMLGVQQTTRLAHDISEQAKIALIYAMPHGDQEEASRIWESEQALLGNDRINELLAHLRTQRIAKRSIKPLEGELQHLYALETGGLDFMRSIFRPHARAMLRIDDRAIGAGMMARVIKGHIDTLGWLDHRQWVAPVLAWLTSKGDLHRETELFFSRLDRLAWLLRIAGTDPHEQENCFIQLTRAVARSEPVDTWPEFEISDRTIEEAMQILRSRTFYFKHISKVTLRRLCYQLGNDPGFIDGEHVTVEHILPRRPPKNSPWFKDFGSPAGVKDYADRLGNLAILSAIVNREADTKEWSLKRATFKKRAGVEFTLAADASEYPVWTKRVILERTEKLIAVLFNHWQLEVPSPPRQ